MSESDQVKGPASYFPSIEKKYGFPVNHWFDLLKQQQGLKHMEMVDWLKREHNIATATQMRLWLIFAIKRLVELREDQLAVLQTIKLQSIKNGRP
ncbi:hypothetical protein OYT1_ch0749 [Ferriphaselus amnicola]|uniref:Uncharacterized protein n=1 Tax=Ferriphaselus amnicola TaxID=1188319 RepID=A0A2Z6GAJ2_9PROT|nr:DUF4287 domain-containing protein [Ferriphaselus amnicola]BBE50315.1 hypothetical protein OYT1_ch0749 [Ferriphaselus amnicola]